MTKQQEQEALRKEILNFQIRSVELLDSSLSTPKEATNIETNFIFNVNLEQKIDQAQKALIVITHVDVAAEANQQKKLGSISTACLFSIENFHEIIKVDDKNLTHKISDSMMEIVNSISISSTRGAMSQIFRGTYLHHAILPIVDPKAFTKSAKKH